jgi:hypothetical protein
VCVCVGGGGKDEENTRLIKQFGSDGRERKKSGLGEGGK